MKRALGKALSLFDRIGDTEDTSSPFYTPPLPPHNDQLCSKCQPWTYNVYGWVYSRPAHIQLSKTQNVPYGSPQQLSSNKSCLLCSTIVALCRQQWGWEGDNYGPWSQSTQLILERWAWHIPPYYKVEDEPDTLDVDSEHKTNCSLWMRAQDMGSVEGTREEFVLQICFVIQRSTGAIIRVEEWQTTFFDPRMLRYWLRSCDKEHFDDCNGRSKDDVSPGNASVTFLIDVERRCVVPAEIGSRYAALSYRWFPSPQRRYLQLETGTLASLQVEGALDRDDFPKSILDAISLCSLLGERYLWVDQLCIVQNDDAHKMAQIRSMDKIYASAAFTIAVAAGDTEDIGIPGLPHRPRRYSRYNKDRIFQEPYFVHDNFETTVGTSVWNSRGWTYQERLLSHRTIFVTEFQVHYMCRRSVYGEEQGNPSPADWWVLEPLDESNPTYDLRYGRIISQYTKRSLTYQTDILNAFAGVGNLIGRVFDTNLVFGLPEAFLPQSLTWKGETALRRRTECPDIPTWSWAAWAGGAIQYNDDQSNGNEWDIHHGTLVRFHIQETTARLRPLQTRDSWFGEPYEESAVLLHNSTFFRRENYLCKTHTPLEAARHGTLDARACLAAAAMPPGCLVFNTTCATLSVRRHRFNRWQNRYTDDRTADLVSIWDSEGGRGFVGSLQLDNNDHHDDKHHERPPEGDTGGTFSAEYEFVVLSAGSTWDFADLHMAEPADEDGDDLLPTLHFFNVVAVRKEGLVSRRCGIGKIWAPAWDCAKPRWETVVLA
ncbi:heterokaryon incompatibility protein-domain-containing protein [Cladorrhinum samala]|uniref:Heterokaryon incompatibility protein-domain-containing protein n=1 Tax=Cladorrhinum samala TaxID=585594 RepID=A0AAV9HNF7_9PEZI|nr:heterokaryon incompatibility protein-domain-containing protein [Cladorrhinum samala]